MGRPCGRRRVPGLRGRLSRTASLLVAALALGLVVMPTVGQVLAPQAAFAQGDQDQNPATGIDAGTASAAAAPNPEDSATPTPSVTPTESATPTASVTATAPVTPTGTPTSGSSTPGGGEPSAPATVDSGSAPTIVSDLADYAPGSTVTLTGVGWQPGEVVTIVVNDTRGLSWSLTQEVVADAEGGITLTFALPAHYVSDYTVIATGTASGSATTTFTDAPLAYNYWTQESNPAGGASVTGGTQITYSVYGQRTSGTAVTATITLTLTGSATFDNSGQDSSVTWSPDRKTATWKPSALGRSSATTVGIKATVASTPAAGPITATVNGDGTRVTSTSQFSMRTHTVPVTNTCHFAAAGSGAYASSICWFDLAGYDTTTAAIGDGQTMRQILPGGYTLTYTIQVGSTDAAAAAKEFPTWSGSYLGNPASGVGGYQGISGMPAIYQNVGGTTTLALSNIRLTHSLDGSGTLVHGFALVGADAESTDTGEWINWTTTAPATFTSIGPLGNACGGGFTGDGTTSVTCTGAASDVGPKNGTAILYSKDPTTFTQSMHGTGLQGVAFGVMVSGVQLIKNVVNPVTTSDAFTISVAGGGTTLSTQTANAASGWKADTKQVYWITAGSRQDFTMTEAAVSPTVAANYAVRWACSTNGKEYPLTDPSATMQTVTLTAFSDFIVCTITNTGPSLTLRKSVENAAGGSLTPANWTLTATGSAKTISSSPVPPWTVSGGGTMTTGSTSTTAVPIGAYALGESDTAAGADRYAAGSWTCTNSGTPMTLSGNTVTLAAGTNAICTITNTYVPAVTVRKTWFNGVNGDKTDLVINNAITAPGKATSTSNGAAGSWADPVTVARATPVVGSTVSIADVMPLANRGTYAAQLACLDRNSAVVAVAAGAFTMPNSDVTCEYTNAVMSGTVTWSKVDAGSTSTLLTGSDWTLIGPSYPSPGTTVADCTSSPCAGPDKDPVAGQFSVPVLTGNYTLAEKTAPTGFVRDATVRTVILTTDGQVVGPGAITNKRSVVPALPLTGGMGTDTFLLTGAALIAAAGMGAWLHRRRLLRL